MVEHELVVLGVAGSSPVDRPNENCQHLCAGIFHLCYCDGARTGKGSGKPGFPRGGKARRRRAD